ncbi:unnamed protein product [Cuscuta europaea]|uniref:Uncharacterized protein n=1 Tax=Cuscuta europaea TaxID=41803 RepID=A0A9P0ZIN3_CUSEU|nr:unnamed protein product [Cuscuta europaea]
MLGQPIQRRELSSGNTPYSSAIYALELRRKKEEKREGKVGFGEENLCLARYSRNFHGVERVAGVVAGVR